MARIACALRRPTLPCAAVLFDQDNFWTARILVVVETGYMYIGRSRGRLPTHRIDAMSANAPPSIRSAPLCDYATRGRLMIVTARAREMVSRPRPAPHLSAPSHPLRPTHALEQSLRISVPLRPRKRRLCPNREKPPFIT